MVVRVHPPGTPLPDNSPLKGTSVIFGIKRPNSSNEQSKTPPSSTKTETEEDGISAGQLRLLKARHQSQAFRDQTLALSQSQSNTPEIKGIYKFKGTLIDGPEINIFHYVGIDLDDKKIEAVLDETSTLNLIRSCPSVIETEVDSCDDSPGLSDSVYEYEATSIQDFRRDLTAQVAEILNIEITPEKLSEDINSIITDTKKYSGMYVKNVTMPHGQEITHNISSASGMASSMIVSRYSKYFGNHPPGWLLDYYHPVQITKACQLALDYNIKLPDVSPC